ncbi:putative superoxide dismutase [Helianthus debilis subsp. tardiflorus]
MQQAALALMAAHSILFSSPTTTTTNPLIFPLSNPNTLHSSFTGVSLKPTLNRQSLTLSAAAAATAPKPLTVVAATKKAVAVLKGTSSVEGVVTLTQEDDGVRK